MAFTGSARPISKQSFHGHEVVSQLATNTHGLAMGLVCHLELSTS
jgi:hypothetical protein